MGGRWCHQPTHDKSATPPPGVRAAQGDARQRRLQLLQWAFSREYVSTSRGWQAVNVSKASSKPDNPILSGAVHGPVSGHCSGVVRQTLAVLGVSPQRACRAAAGNVE